MLWAERGVTLRGGDGADGAHRRTRKQFNALVSAKQDVAPNDKVELVCRRHLHRMAWTHQSHEPYL